jgi:CMP-N-acetylneuraminic acid synthetase
VNPSGVLALIPARGGSRGIPDKNIRLLAGRTLLDYAADAARSSKVVDRIVLTTDSERIAVEGRRLGIDVPFLRPPELARDDTPMLPVIEHAVDALEQQGWNPDVIVLLQPTSPFRRPGHIRAAVEQLRETNADSVVSVVELPMHMSPDYVMRIDEGRLVPFLPAGAAVTRRQDARRAVVRDGTVYAFWRRTLRETRTIYGRDSRPMIVPAHESITIDAPDDWIEAERRLAAAGVPHR